MINQDFTTNEVVIETDQFIPAKARQEMALCISGDRLAAALSALRMALHAFDRAPGTLCETPPDSLPEDAIELRRRWAACSIILHCAVTTVEQAGTAMINAMRVILAV